MVHYGTGYHVANFSVEVIKEPLADLLRQPTLPHILGDSQSKILAMLSVNQVCICHF